MKFFFIFEQIKERNQKKLAKIRASDSNNGFIENILKQEKKQSKEDISFLLNSLKANFFFVNFSDAEL